MGSLNALRRGSALTVFLVFAFLSLLMLLVLVIIDFVLQTNAFPGGFAIIDSAGRQYAAESERSKAYTSQTDFIWPPTFPVGRPITLPLVFDVDPAAQGLELVIFDVPQTRIRIR